MTGARSGYLQVLGAIILFSTIEVAAKYLQTGRGPGPEVGSLQVAALRFLVGALFLLPPLLGLSRNRRLVVSALSEDGPGIALVGSVGVFFTFILFHEGIELGSASMAVVLFSMNPVVTAVVARLVLREHLGGPGWAGVFVGLLGAFIAITGFKFSGIFGRGEFLAGMIILGADVCWAVYTVFGKKYSERYGGLVTASLSVSVGAIMFTVLLTVTGGWGELGGYAVNQWLCLLFLGTVTVGLGYILYFRGLSRVPAARGASLFYVKPVLGVLFAHLLLGESISCSIIVAAALAAGGIALVTWSRSPEKAEP